MGWMYHLFHAASGNEGSKLYLAIILPFAFVGMTLRLFTSMEITTFFVLIFTIAMVWLTQNTYIGLLTLCASLAGSARMRYVRQRLDIFIAGIFVAGLQSILVMMGWSADLLPMPTADHTLIYLLFATGLSLASGVLSSSLVLGFQPLLEYLGYTTDLRLIELASTNHRLLKEMILKAPGTYFHSFAVSQLAEKAAESVNGNPLFAKVASLYHDIGKIKKPHYFIENIKNDNKHDQLAPSMSAIIIANHVKDGIELGQKYKLPKNIIEVIPQHHGTSLIAFFYNKAKIQSQPQTVDAKDYRYPGPKPQTREAAIILLADAVEATSKTLKNNTTDEFRRMIHATIQRFFLDGQLDECDLSLKDLTAIGNSFLEVLRGIHHQRIDYPHLHNLEETVKSGDS